MRIITMLIAVMLAFGLTACGASEQTEEQNSDQTVTSSETEEQATEMKMLIGDEAVDVSWEDNDAVAALGQEVQKQPLAVEMVMYEDFEQVGELGVDLPANDEQIETESGDIMLYAGNKIVVFYGSNTWDYTPLGKITDKSPEEMASLLGQGDVTITIQNEMR